MTTRILNVRKKHQLKPVAMMKDSLLRVCSYVCTCYPGQ